MGIERLIMILEMQPDTPHLIQKKPLYVVMPLSKEQQPLALLVSDMLHAAGLVTDTLFDQESLKSMMRKANKMGALSALIIGENEQQNKTISSN